MTHQFIKTLMEDQKRINVCLEEAVQKRLMQLSEHYAADVFDPINDILQNDTLPAKKVADITKRFGSVENAAAWVCGIASIVFQQHDMPVSDKELLSLFFSANARDINSIKKYFMSTQLKSKFDETDFQMIGNSLPELNRAIIARGKKVKAIPAFTINGKPFGYDMVVHVLQHYADSELTADARVQFTKLVLKLKSMLDTVIKQRITSLIQDKEQPINHLEQVIGAL